MKLAIGLAGLFSVMCVQSAHADCKESAAAPATIDVYDCDASTKGGMVVGGYVTWKKGGASEDLRTWVPTSGDLFECSKLAEPVVLTASVQKLCCDPRKGEACEAGASATASSPKLSAPTPAKKASRAQLESEVDRLRAANARLRKDLWRLRKDTEAYMDKLRREQQQLSHQIK